MPLSPDIERRKTEETRPILPDHRLLFPNPGFLMGAAAKKTQDQMGKVDTRLSELDINLLRKNGQMFGNEYFSLLKLISDHVDRRNITFVRNRVLMANVDPQTQRRLISSKDFPEFEEVTTVRLKAFNDHPTIWTRDGFTTIGDVVFLNPLYFPDVQESETVIKSFLGEGGSVLVARNAVLVSEDLWRRKNQDRGFEVLKKLGFAVAPLPPVDPNKQKYSFINESHIDCHANLIVDRDGKLWLLVADSYSRQGNGTRKKIRFAADTIGARVFEIDDSGLPPLAFNFIQFADKTVVVTGSETADLTFILGQLLEKEKVLKTDIPLVEIPKMLAGSIRCMTNTLPRSVLRKLETLV